MNLQCIRQRNMGRYCKAISFKPTKRSQAWTMVQSAQEKFRSWLYERKLTPKVQHLPIKRARIEGNLSFTLLQSATTTKFWTTQSEYLTMITIGLQLHIFEKIQCHGDEHHNSLQPMSCLLTISWYCAIQNKFNAKDMSYLFGDKLW
jgi:hypothetical protein